MKTSLYVSLNEKEKRRLKHLIFLNQSRAQMFMSLQTPETAGKALLDFLKEMAEKYGCGYQEIMADGSIKRSQK